MTWTEWFIFLLIIQIIHGLATWKLYVKASKKAWEAFVPIYNGVVLLKIINRPWWWLILLFLPIVNLIMIPAVWVETARAYGKDTKLDALLCIITLGFYLFYLNYIAEVNYVENRQLKPKTAAGEWITSILFAIVAATIVHTYFFQPYVIPSSSLEKSLLVGDFLIVSKLHYGARAPMTTVGAPMVHDTIPKLGIKSYLFDDNFDKKETSWKNKLQLPYFRFPAFEDIERNDIVVFGQPADTLVDMNDFNPDRNYYKPIDKKTNLVKRCVGLPGDTLEVRNGYVYINGKQNELPDRAKLQFTHIAKLKNFQVQSNVDYSRMKSILKKYDITDDFSIVNASTIIIHATDEATKKVVIHPNIQSIEPYSIIKGERREKIFPLDPSYNWNANHFGPLFIPKQGATVNLTIENLPLYKRAISEYEGHKVVTRGNQILIDDKPATSYTFARDYFWMMGDNRHNSIDSRYWGFVPDNHIIGKPVFIWMSIDGINDGLRNWSVRWDRVFTTVSGNGKTTSYFIPFLLFLVVCYFVNKMIKSQKQITDKKIEGTSISYASINDRIKAAVIDGFLIIVFMYIVTTILSLFGEVPSFVKMIFLVFIFLLYDPLLTTFYGGTIGHTISNISVRKNVDLNKNIDLPNAIIRFLIKASLGWVSLITIGSSDKKEAIHDKVVKSVVIQKAKKANT